MSDVNHDQPPQLLQVVLLGDHATADQIDMLQELGRVYHMGAGVDGMLSGWRRFRGSGCSMTLSGN